MSHEIFDANYGSARFAYNVEGAGKAWWDGMQEKGNTLKGIPMPVESSCEDYILATGMDFFVKREKAYADIDGTKVYVGQDVIYRQEEYDNTPVQYSVVSADWNHVDHMVAIGETVDQFISLCHEVGRHDVKMESLGGLFNGELCFGLVSLGDGFTILGKDSTRSYMNFANRHKYGTGIISMPTNVRIECNNTFQLAMREDGKNKVSVNHRMEFTTDSVLRKLDEAHKFLDAYKHRAEFLAGVKVSDETLKEYFGNIFPIVGKNSRKKELSRSATQCLEYFDNQPGASLGSGTWWNAFNSVTHHLDHVAARTIDTRLNNSMFGAGVNLKTKALDMALDMASA